MQSHPEAHILVEAWKHPPERVLEACGVATNKGLSKADAAQRLRTAGPNRLDEHKQRGPARIFIDQLCSAVIALLAVAAGFSFWFGGVTEGYAILAVIGLNTLIGFGVELRALRSMDALRSLGNVRTRVRREGSSAMLDAEQIVPGDILVLEAGDRVTADARIVSASRLRVDESTFTGESVPVDKHIDAIDVAPRVDQRLNMLFKGTALTMGTCEALVVATGMSTGLGHISRLTEGTQDETTPLEKQLATVGHKLIGLTIVITIAVAAAGILAGKPIQLMVEAGVALAVATIPEGLPIVATIALASGLLRMSKRNVLINRLSAVETLGVVSVLCTDKTGTLTENRMSLAEVALESGSVDLREPFTPTPELRTALEIGVLCNRASLGGQDDDSQASGDPLEVALLLAGQRLQLRRAELCEMEKEVGSIAFDAVDKRMATFHQQGDKVRIAVKGAPEQVILACERLLTASGEQHLSPSEREAWLARAESMAGRGLRIIAVAQRLTPEAPENAYEELTLVALFGLIDPPRLEVRAAIEGCHKAGIRVLMITGDHPATARAIAQAVGLSPQDSPTEQPSVQLGAALEDLDSLSDEQKRSMRDVALFARVSPKQKLNIIHLHQQAETVVAMIGDGVNDAPALQRADIGIAMGQRGTQVAQEASEMILSDDSFDSVLPAVEQGRIIFGNIRKFVVYLLSCNISEVLILGIASAVHAPLPILPLQILFLNLVTDIFPALALGVGPGPQGIMQRGPRDAKEGILTRAHGRWIVGHGALITACVLGAFYLCLGPLDLGRESAVTVSFLTLAFAQLWHVFNMRDAHSRIFDNEIVRNPFIWAALALCILLTLLALYVPLFSKVLELHPPSPQEWSLIALFSMLPLLLGQGRAIYKNQRRRAAQC